MLYTCTRYSSSRAHDYGSSRALRRRLLCCLFRGAHDYGSGHVHPAQAGKHALRRWTQASSTRLRRSRLLFACASAGSSSTRPLSAVPSAPAAALPALQQIIARRFAWPGLAIVCKTDRVIAGPSSVSQVILPVHPRASSVPGFFFRSLVLLIGECFF